MPRQEPMKSVASAIFYSMDSTLSADFIKILLAQIFKTVFYQVPKIWLVLSHPVNACTAGNMGKI